MFFKLYVLCTWQACQNMLTCEKSLGWMIVIIFLELFFYLFVINISLAHPVCTVKPQDPVTIPGGGKKSSVVFVVARTAPHNYQITQP
jgi:hypothetical protein